MRLHPLVFLGLVSTLFAANPFAGTWQLNVGKSKFAGPPDREETVVMVEKDDQIVVTRKGIAGDGKPISAKYSYPEKGGPVIFVEGAPPSNISETRNRINERTMEAITKSDGNVVATTHYVVSEDGQTITIHRQGKNSQGQAFEFVGVYERK